METDKPKLEDYILSIKVGIMQQERGTCDILKKTKLLFNCLYIQGGTAYPEQARPDLCFYRLSANTNR